MSNIVEFVKQQEQFFTPVVVDNAVKWEKESQFAIQAFQKNDFLAKVAISNPTSAQNAIINVAAIGITLNPSAKLAYLVPRDGGVCLDISYMGLLHLAMQSGSILWGQCKLVHEKDEYENLGLDRAPMHKYNAFGDRGEIVGGFCTVKTPSGDYLTEEMNLKDIQKVEMTSKSRNGPWKTFWEEMARKTIVKRAYKYWPKVERLDRAIEYLNTNNDEGFEQEPVMPHYSDEQKESDKKEQEQQLASMVQEHIDHMEIAESENQLKASFQEAYKLTRNHKQMNQEVQKIYAKNKQRLGVK